MLGWIQTILIGLMKSVFGIGGSGGVPTAPTASLATNTTQLATTAFVLANTGSSGVALGDSPTWTGIHTFTPTARSSGSAAYLTVNAPADTGLTASTEAIGVNFVGATRQHATGALATQREYVFAAPTYSFVGASTITEAATVAVTDAPTAGTNATITRSYSLWIKSALGTSKRGVRADMTGSGTSFAYEANISSTGGGNYGFYSSTTGAGTFNVGFYVGVCSGATNNIGLQIDGPAAGANNYAINSNATAVSSFAGGMTVAAGATGVIAGTFKGAASRTVAILQIQSDAAVSLGSVGGCIFDDISNGATTSTDGTFDTILTHTIAANTLLINGDKIEMDCTLTMVAHALSTDQVKVTFAGITVFDSGANNFATAGTARLYVQIIRKTSTTCRATVEFVVTGSATVFAFSSVQYTTESTLTGLTLTGTNVLAVTAAATGTNSASGDVKMTMGSVDAIPSA